MGFCQGNRTRRSSLSAARLAKWGAQAGRQSAEPNKPHKTKNMNITPHIEKPLNLGWNQARITVALSLLLVVTALAVLIYTVAEVLL